jgi:hypothetical protein
MVKLIENLYKHLNVCDENTDLPVAFATNALYVLERTNSGDKELYEKVLIPILKRKISNLHEEGLAHAVWALSNAGIYNADVWELLKTEIQSKKFNSVFV